MTFTTSLILSALLATPSPQVEKGGTWVYGKPVPELQALDNAMTAYMLIKGIPYGAMGVIRDGTIVLAHGYNVSEVQPFRLASVEKPICAAAIQALVADGDLAMDEFVFDLGQPGGGVLQITPWLGLGSEAYADITVEMLITHHSGLPDNSSSGNLPDPMLFTEEIAILMNIAGPAGRLDIARWVLGQGLDNPAITPGTPGSDGFAYSNFGYMILGLVVEERSGMNFHQYLHQRVFPPEDGVSTSDLYWGRTHYDNQGPEPWYAHGNNETGDSAFGGPDVLMPYGYWNHEAMIGHGNLVAGLVPLLRFMDRYEVASGKWEGWMPGVPATYGEPHLGSPPNGGMSGFLWGTTSTIIQRSDGVHVAVLFSYSEPGEEGGGYLASEAANLVLAATGGITTWPTQAVDGYWVDLSISGANYGGYSDPFSSMKDLTNYLGPGAKVNFKAGSKAWTGTLSKPMELTAPEGAFVLGG